MSWRYDDDGMLVLSARLAPEHGARVIAAIDQLRHAGAGAESSAEDSDPKPGTDDNRRADTGADSSVDESRHSCDETPKPGRGAAQALVAMADQILTHGPRPTSTGELYRVVIHADRTALTGDRDRGGINGARCHLRDGPSLHPATLRRLTCDGGTTDTITHTRDGTPLDAGRATRTVPTRLRRAVIDRADARCQYPGCPHKTWLQLHHVTHWIDGGRTDYTNLCLLCSHHHRAHHAGAFTIAHDPQAPGHFRFRLADGTDVDHAPHPPTLTDDLEPGDRKAGDLTDHHDAPITADTIIPAWHGDRLDLDYAALVMSQ